jgi:hypothetical protein
MAISGAAVSPAMGKMSQGPIGRLFAVLNVRLGVWLPHPEWVNRFIELERTPAAAGGRVPAEADAMEAALPRWVDRPGWPYLFREVLGRFRFANRYLYVSDGGHWENLGLVELLRRGCTEVVCISAAGDGPSSFATIAEAIALAREELGVEVEIELSPLRALIGELAATAAGGAGAAAPSWRARRRAARQLLSGGLAPVARAYADRPSAVGTIRYPASARHDGRAVTGRLVVVEANLTAALPWDVQAFAEGTPRFPDESTSDQFFDHRQFEAYRRLGQYQMDTALSSVEWALATSTRPVADPPARASASRRRASVAGAAATPDPPVRNPGRSRRPGRLGPPAPPAAGDPPAGADDEPEDVEARSPADGEPPEPGAANGTRAGRPRRGRRAGGP